MICGQHGSRSCAARDRWVSRAAAFFDPSFSVRLEVLGCGEHLWLVVDAPYVRLKVWPMALQDLEIRGERVRAAVLSLERFALKDLPLARVDKFLAALSPTAAIPTPRPNNAV